MIFIATVFGQHDLPVFGWCVDKDLGQAQSFYDGIVDVLESQGVDEESGHQVFCQSYAGVALIELPHCDLDREQLLELFDGDEQRLNLVLALSIPKLRDDFVSPLDFSDSTNEAWGQKSTVFSGAKILSHWVPPLSELPDLEEEFREFDREHGDDDDFEPVEQVSVEDTKEVFK